MPVKTKKKPKPLTDHKGQKELPGMPGLGPVEERAFDLRKAQAVVEDAKEKCEGPKLDLIKSLEKHGRKDVTIEYEFQKYTYILEDLKKLTRKVA